MGVVDFLTFDKCLELSIYSNERRLINCVLTFLLHKSYFFTDSAVAILPVSVRLTDKPVNIMITRSYDRVSLKDDGPTGQTTGQRGSDPSAYRVSKR